MLYCPRCNNSHWARVAAKTAAERLLVLVLRRRYRCLKCNKVMSASIFTDFKWPRLGIPRKKKHIKGTGKGTVCPKCGKAARRSHRLIWERLLLVMKTYRCTECRHRFRGLGR